jgi:methionyl-tRNA formyltransferase
MRVVMLGTGTFAEPTFEALLAAFPGQVAGLVTQPDRDGVKLRGSSRQTGQGMAALAAAAGVPVIQPVSINKPDGLDAFRALRPDLCVVAAYGQILSRAVIETPPVGMVNVHASLLPKYRGASPIAHAILAGETVTGVTILRVVPGLDAGDMLAKAEVAIGDHETTGELEARLAPLGAALCVDVVRRMQAGPVAGEPQDPALVTKAPKFTKEHGLIDWAEPAEVIARKVRAFQPWPTAYTFLHRPGKPPLRVMLTRTDGLSVTRTSFFPTQPVPGDMLWLPVPGSLSVFTGRNGLVLAGLQPAGGKRMSAGEFARGYLVDGARFGPEVVG